MTNTLIKSAKDLITPREETRSGFIAMALEKNFIAVPYIEEAKALKALTNKVSKPKDLLKIKDVQTGLLTAAGLSDKSLRYLTEEDRRIAIVGLIEKFLDPAGENFIDELVYRYLLTKGDALGGKARNLAGALGERKFLRTLISVFHIAGVDYKWKDAETNVWLDKPTDDTNIEKRVKEIYWSKESKDRLLLFNITVPIVNKNVDIVILNGVIEDTTKEKKTIISDIAKYIALGELKGGIDPAGADEHWKTANTALNRIRASFSSQKQFPQTFFIGAAIENSMADEIYEQIKTGIIDNAANLTNDKQLATICDWILNL